MSQPGLHVLQSEDGLKKAGQDKAAKALQEKGWTLFQQNWREQRLCPENYHPETGEGLDQPDTDPFYSWSALLAYMSISE